TRPSTRSMASATIGTNFSTTPRKKLLRTVLPKIRAISVARYNPYDFGRPLPCSTARSTHCALVAPAPASATTSVRWYGDGNGSPGRREFSGRISRILPARTVAFCCDTPEPNDLPIRAPPDGLPQFVGTSALDR